MGGGAAGLAAAWWLVRGGARVTLYDSSDRAGGALRTETIDGARVDVGVQLVSSTYTALFELARDVGAAALLRSAPGRDALWRKDRPHAITYGSVTSMALSSALPTTLKLRLATKYLPFLTTQARHLDANDLIGSGGVARDATSIGAWGKSELGEDFVELLVYPLLAAYYGATPEETSAAFYHALARVGMDVSVYACTGGFGALADAVVAQLRAAGSDVVKSTRVERIHVLPDGVEIEAAGTRTGFDAVVVAVPARTVLSLLDAGGPWREWLGNVRERSALTVAYRTSRPFPGDYFGLSFPRHTRSGSQLAAVCVQGRKLSGLVPSGGEALVALPAPGALAELWERSDDDVAEQLLAAIEAAVSGVSRRVTAVQVTRFAQGYTLFSPGYLKQLSAFDEAWLPSGVTLAGDYLVAPTVEGAVRSGRHAARRLLDRHARG